MDTKRNFAPDDEMVTSVRLTRRQHDALRRIAATQHRTMAGELRMLIEAHIAAHEPRAHDEIAEAS